ncbi:uroporphyrinogen-III synthase [Meiothermus sp.]|jgi:uroporphyrinogen-III synthase|uniref:uroporphyrinogen-III synthase n=1 Tax=Meiothermus sp. TaxID=1955249 RepID=UPI0021DE4200|nr:uroporphyrinogen-III synthase [Meiothermus sp.]GIW24137.1 MAG: hypothetical protein KatS3mg069_0404 [Meiothermus sp.]
MTVALTQSEGRLEGLQEALEAEGLEVWRVPLIETHTLQADLRPLLDCRWWLFTSVAAVRALQELGVRPEGQALGAVGAATQRALEAAFGPVELVAPQETSESLAEAFLARRPFGFVGLPQGNLARPVLSRRLQEAGYTVRSVVVYETRPKPWPPALPAPDLVLLASPSAVWALPASVGQQAHCLALGPTTAQALEERGFPHTIARPDPEAILAAILNLRGEPCST